VHDNDQDIVRRLRRIEGQVMGIRKMHEDGRYCFDVLDHISAARGWFGTLRRECMDRLLILSH
jgi:DNA-binding FrmR family transcriptional regulator